MNIEVTSVSGRSCGTCTLCCRLPDIEAFSKPANEWCSNCSKDGGCSIYEVRPQLCRDFFCLWMTTEALGEEWEPTRSKMMVYRQGPQLTVLVDPEFPNMWRLEPYYTWLQEYAGAARGQDGYVIVFVGDDVFKVEP